MIQSELTHIIAQVENILSNPEDSASELRWHSAVIAYGRCFNSADGRGTRLEERHVRKLGDNQIILHKDIINIRDQYIAHSGQNEQQRVFVALPIFGTKDNPRLEQVVYPKITEISPGHQHFQKFRQLAAELFAAVGKMLAKAEKALLVEYATGNLSAVPAEAISAA